MLLIRLSSLFFLFFFFNDTATTEIYTLSLHDALPISREASAQATTSHALRHRRRPAHRRQRLLPRRLGHQPLLDRKSTRLNSSHLGISYAVFCLKKKKKQNKHKTKVTTHTQHISTQNN